jgi:hypothetical protein
MTDQELFHEDMKNIYTQCAKLNYKPTIFLNMVNNYGGYEAAKRLLAQHGHTHGFNKLYEMGRLDLSMEALILEKWSHLFTEKEIDICRKRLLELGYKNI